MLAESLWKADPAGEIGRAGDENESEIFYVREKLDGEILPAKAAAEHADDG